MDTPIITTHSVADSADQHSPKNNLEKVSFIVFLITVILVPLAFLPISYAPLDISKTVVIAFGVLVSAILYFISAFKQKSLFLPKHPLVLAAAGIIVSLLVSTFLSASPMKSFFGQGFELTTSSLVLIFFLASLLVVYLTHKERDRMLYIYGGVILSFLLVALFHIVRFIGGPELLSFGFFQMTSSTLVGKWNDLALIAGCVGIISYIGLQFITLNKLFKILLTVLLAISGVFLFIVNSAVIWWVAALVLAGIAYYQFQSSASEPSLFKKLPLFTLILLIISVACAWKGNVIAAPVINALKIEQAEITLPWQLTLDVASDTVKESPLFGSGPNRFGSQYLKFKPEGINMSNAWNVEFNNG